MRPNGNEIVEYPKSAVQLSTNTTILKYTSGIPVTHEEMFNAELEGSYQYNGSRWHLYDYKLQQIAELSDEYVRFTGINSIPIQGTAQEAIEDAQKSGEEPERVEHISYDEYLDEVLGGTFRMDKRGTYCSRTGFSCSFRSQCRPLTSGGPGYCSCSGRVCATISLCSDGIC